MGNEEFTLRNNVTLLDLNNGLRDQRTCLQYEASMEGSQKGLALQIKAYTNITSRSLIIIP
jgi:hypothetical protein